MKDNKIRWVVRLHECKSNVKGSYSVGIIRSQEPLTDSEKDMIIEVLLKIQKQRDENKLKLSGLK